MKTITPLSILAVAILAAPTLSAASPAPEGSTAATVPTPRTPTVSLRVVPPARGRATPPTKSAQGHEALVPMTKQKCGKCKCKKCKYKGYKGKKYKCKKCKCKKCDLGGEHKCKKCKCKKCDFRGDKYKCKKCKCKKC